MNIGTTTISDIEVNEVRGAAGVFKHVSIVQDIDVIILDMNQIHRLIEILNKVKN